MASAERKGDVAVVSSNRSVLSLIDSSGDQQSVQGIGDERLCVSEVMSRLWAAGMPCRAIDLCSFPRLKLLPNAQNAAQRRRASNTCQTLAITYDDSPLRHFNFFIDFIQRRGLSLNFAQFPSLASFSSPLIFFRKNSNGVE